MSTALVITLTALAYAATGWMSLQLSIPPDYVSLVFLPAGVGLGATLIRGPWAALGVFLGSLAVHVMASLQVGELRWGWVSLLSPTCAGLQALIGAALARRWTGYPGPMDTPVAVMRLLLGVVPLSCLLNASISVPLLVHAQIIPAVDALFSWWTWWMGDALGAALVLPLMLVFMGQPAALWRPRRAALAVPMGLTTLLVGAGILMVNRWEREDTEQRFERESKDLASLLQRRLDAQTDSVLAVSRLFVLSDQISPAEYDVSVTPWLQRYPGTQNFGWSPLITQAQREAYEKRMSSREGAHFFIKGRGADGRTFMAPQRPEYLPLSLIEPRETNTAAMGLDVMVLPTTAEAVRLTRQTGAPHVTAGLRLVQESREQRGVVMYQAVYDREHRERLKGVVSAVFRMDDVLSSALGSLQPRAMLLCLEDSHAPADNRRLAGPAHCETPAWTQAKLVTRLPVQFGDRQWALHIKASEAYNRADRNWSAWAMVALGLMSVGLLGAFLLVITGHARRTEALVAQRTAELAHSNAGLQQLAHYDILTGLPNRSFWLSQARTALMAAQRHQHSLAILFLDLDHFKHVNDTLGHAVGDQLLQTVARRLLACLRAEDVLARLGGDEFVALLPHLSDARHADTVASKFLRVLATPLPLGEHEVTLTVSVGIATYTPGGPDHDVDTLLRHADTAMYAAKDSGRNAYRTFTADMNERVSQRLFLENGLRRALERGELFLEYQPQVASHSLRVLGLEALVRWQHPEQGLISPAQFIGVAEDSGLIAPLGRWVLGEACAQLRRLVDLGYTDLQMAVNISPLQFQQADFVQTVREALDQHGLAAGQLELEITETLLMQPEHDLQARLGELSTLGVTLALDDFGTGYSSLGYLKRLPLSRLKLDRSFVQDVPGDVEDEAITRATLSMARDLGLDVVAEGVETDEQCDYLTTHGCPVMQGWLFARALREDSLRVWLDQHAPLSAATKPTVARVA